VTANAAPNSGPPEPDVDDAIVKALVELIGREAARRVAEKSKGTTNKNANGARNANVSVGIHDNAAVCPGRPPTKSLSAPPSDPEDNRDRR
jgi:hypothetical protein